MRGLTSTGRQAQHVGAGRWLALSMACVLAFAVLAACGGEDAPTPTPGAATPAPPAVATTAPAVPTATAALTTPVAMPTAAATATTPRPTATQPPSPAAPAATPTSGSSSGYGEDYGDDYGTPATATPEPAAPAPAATGTPAPPTPDPTTPPPPAAPQEVEVIIQNFRFDQETLTIPVGTTVTWTNRDGAQHSATADDGSFNTGLLATNQSASITFDTPGTYTYYCLLHPSMTATVIVTG
jgi:plastocyanin